MKKHFILQFVLLAFLVFLAALPAKSQDKPGYSTVYFILRSSSWGLFSYYGMFIDTQFVCALHPQRYSVHQVAIGEHTISSEYKRKISRVDAERITINIEAGKCYYINLEGIYGREPVLHVRSVNAAQVMVPRLKIEKDCGTSE